MHLRLRASGMHLLTSAVAASLAAAVVFGAWYPSPYTSLAGGLTLFLLLVGVDMVLGPLLTFLVASPKKSRSELMRDIAMIVAVQVLAFGYGLMTLAEARPVGLVFEVDRFRVVSAVEVQAEQLGSAPSGLGKLSWFGPKLIATRKPSAAGELLESMSLGLSGIDLAMQPRYWVPYETTHADVLARARPVTQLIHRFPGVEREVEEMARRDGLALEQVKFLPVTSRHREKVILVRIPDAAPLGVIDADGFF